MDRLSDTSASFLTLLLWIIRRLCVTSGMCEHACVTLSTSGADIDGRRASAAADSRQPYIQTDYLNNPRLPEPSGPALCSVLITPAPLYLPPPSGGRCNCCSLMVLCLISRSSPPEEMKGRPHPHGGERRSLQSAGVFEVIQLLQRRRRWQRRQQRRNCWLKHTNHTNLKPIPSHLTSVYYTDVKAFPLLPLIRFPSVAPGAAHSGGSGLCSHLLCNKEGE